MWTFGCCCGDTPSRESIPSFVQGLFPKRVGYSSDMKSASQYQNYRKPSWAPPSWVFGPVWTFLYILIAISFGYATVLYFKGVIPFIVLLPFLLNLVFNAAFTPIQFRLRNFALALA